MSAEAMRMDTLDFFDLDAFARGVPHAFFDRLRAESPVSWQRIKHLPGDEGFWLVTRHQDICEVARQPGIFFSHGGSVISDAVDIPHPAWKMVREGLCHLDAPRHGALRRMVMPPFGAEAVAALEPMIRRRAVQALDRIQGQGKFDVATELATRFPATVVYADVLGFAEEDLAAATYWGDLFNRVHAIPLNDRDFAMVMRDAGAELDRLYRYGVEAYKARRESPRADVLSVLANLQFDDGRGLELEDFLSYFWSLAIGAYDTTASTIAGGIAALAANPIQCEDLYAHPELIESAIEEMLRWESPVIYFRRTAAQDYVLNNQQIRKGDRVVMCFASGNRDEAAFESAHQFNIRRRPNNHLSFGHGAHFCLGARLARMELRILFEEIVDRRFRFRPTQQPARARSNFINRIVCMPVKLEMALDFDVMSFD